MREEIPSWGFKSRGVHTGDDGTQNQCPRFDASPVRTGSPVLSLLQPGKM
jgi:hypothetical protein